MVEDKEDKKESPEIKDTPPKQERKKRGPNTKTKWAKSDIVAAALTNYFSGIEGVLAWVNPADASVIAEGSAAVVKELVELGRVDRNVRRALEKLAAPGKYGPLTLAIAPMAIALAANHGLIPQLKIFSQEKLQEKSNNIGG